MLIRKYLLHSSTIFKDQLKMDKRDSLAERQISLTLDLPETEPELQKEINNFTEKNSVKENALMLWKCIRVYLIEYCDNSSLHGVKYFGGKGRTISERIWWFLIFIASILMCSNLIMRTWDKWDTNPIIISFAQSPTPVWQVPFPAVTICPVTKFRRSVYNFTEVYNSIKKIEDVSLICDNYLHRTGSNTTNSAIDFFHEVAPQFNETMWICKWTNNLNTSCRELFYPIITEEGLCYTFNMLDRSELFNSEAQGKHYINHGKTSNWRTDEGYKKGIERNVYPRRTIGAGIKSGLTIVMRAYDYDLDYICKDPVQGFKSVQFRASLNQEVNVVVKPDMMTTSDGLKAYHPSRRHCYFQGEKELLFFKVYTQQNCEVECFANFILERCGCVAFYMPRANDTPICGSRKTHCLALLELNLLLREVETELAEENVNNCNCLPACTALAYSAETSQVDFNWVKMFQSFQSNMGEFKRNHMTRVKIFFKDLKFITSRRSELYGPTDFLANCGGLLGLFMGFSFLSLVEIVYFLTLRVWCNIKMHGRQIWNASRVNSLH